MKIAYLSTFYPFRGGIAQFNSSLFREFEKDNDIKAFTFKRQYPDLLFPGTSQYVNENDKVDKVESLELVDSINPLSYISTARKINIFKPNLLIMKFWMPFFAPSLGYVAGYLKKRGVKVISILDNVIPHEKRPGDIALTKYFLNRNDAFIVMSNAVQRDLLSLKPDAKFKLQMHPLYDHFGKSVEKTEARKSLGLDTDKKILLFFGFIRDYKGLDLLISAMKNLPEDYLLVIAGEVYGDFSKYDRQIGDLGVSDKIKKFVRYINDDEVPLFFSAADVCVQPYKSATQSGIVGISYHFNLPVIATDVGGLKEMIAPYGTGILLDSSDVDQIVDGVKKYFEADISLKCIENIEKMKLLCSWKSFSDSIMELYEKI
jgi:glycosyltransferase involved in cell wall biosynthesis